MYKKKFLTCPQIAMVINPLKYHVQCTMRIVCKLFNCNCKPQGLIWPSLAVNRQLFQENQISTSESINHFSSISFNYKMNLIVGTSQYGILMATGGYS